MLYLELDAIRGAYMFYKHLLFSLHGVEDESMPGFIFSTLILEKCEINLKNVRKSSD